MSSCLVDAEAAPSVWGGAKQATVASKLAVAGGRGVEVGGVAGVVPDGLRGRRFLTASSARAEREDAGSGSRRPAGSRPGIGSGPPAHG